MFNKTRNDYRTIRNSGISPFGAVIFSALLFVVMPFVNLGMWYNMKFNKDFGQFKKEK
jgi:hypothetical protein